LGSRGEGELVAKLVWRVKLVAEFQAGVTTEVEVGRFERDEQASVADLGLRLGEAKQIIAALPTEMVPRQVTVVGERHRLCATCGCVLASKGYYPATFRSSPSISFPLRTVDGWSLRMMQGLRLFSGAGSTGGLNEWDRRLCGRNQG